MQRNSNEKVLFPEVLSRLKSNDPKWDTLSIHDIIASPVEKELYPGHTDIISRVGDEELIQLAQGLKNNISIETFIFKVGLDFNSSKTWTSYGIKVLADVLKDHPKLNSIIFAFYQEEIDLDIFSCLSGSAPIDTLRIVGISRERLNIVGSYLKQRNTIKELFVDCTDVRLSEVKVPDFMLGIQNQRSLKNFYFNSNLIIDDHVAELVERGLSGTTSLVELRLPIFSSVHIKSICAVLKKNIRLARLYLERGILDDKKNNDIGELCDALFYLPKLVYLYLPALTEQSLEYFVNFYRNRKLMIPELSIHKEYDENSISSIMSFIDGNSFLRKLNLMDLKFSTVDSCIQQMRFLLMDPKRCQLESLRVPERYYAGRSEYTFLKIVEKNENICDLYAPFLTKDFQLALSRNRINKFIKTIAVLCHVYTSSTYNSEQKQTFSSLKPNTFRLILSFLSVEGVELTEQQKILCGQIMLNNFTKRRELIDSKQYDPKNPDIKQWWSNSYDGKTLFKKKNDAAPVVLLEEKKEEAHKAGITWGVEKVSLKKS